MHRGYVKLYRKIVDSSFYKNPLVSHLANHCIIKANHKKQKIYFNNKEIELLPGQFITGRNVLSIETGLSQQSVRTSLKILSNIGFLTIKSTNKFSFITIVKYRDYQSEEENQPANQPAANQQPTSSQPAANHRQECKNDKNDKNTSTASKTIFSFSGDILKINEVINNKFLKTYPNIDLMAEYQKMDTWLVCHPEKKYKKYSAFANNWLSRCQTNKNKGGTNDNEPYIP